TWADTPGHAHVRCWAPTGAEIELCGHGLLCCATHWQGRWGAHGVLEMNGMAVRFESRGGMQWVGFPNIETTACAVPDWAAELLGATPIRAAVAGPASGYLVLELAAGCDPAALRAPGEALAAHSARSLIVTRGVTAADSLHGETIQSRYFAPQYGVPEDAATGSAMRVLASYWHSRGEGSEQKALQRSAAGGWLESRIEGEHTWIGGHVVVEEAA
ncbi:MAG: PhzF family phenazine biosynthesis protein, partial [Gammaproteobacteria bacterium]|nr:PhzF family phenazine biosynthesis protein [Gammaproteobacteria bacterium]